MSGMKLWVGLGVLVLGLATRQEGPFGCPPCGADCHASDFERAGNCSGCGMALVPRASVPQVGVLLFPGTDVMSFGGPAGVFASSQAMNVLTVSDTTDPVRCQGFLEVVPQYSFDDAPAIDVLIVGLHLAARKPMTPRTWIWLALVGVLAADDSDGWPHWRGPERSGVSLETGWASRGGAEPLWKASVGLGHSCPSVVDGRLFTLGFDESLNLDVVSCLDAVTGVEIWARTYPGQIRNSGHGGGTLTTPAVDEGRVYVSTREGELRCLDSETGEVVWMRALAEEHETVPLDYGFGGSPLVLADRVICNLGKTVAVDRQTGETLWATRDHLALYSTPTRFQLDGEPTIAVFTKEGLFLLDEDQGSELRHFPWRKGKVTVNAATPVVVEDKLFISSSYNHGCALVDIAAEKPAALWESRVMRTQLSGAVFYEGHLYGFDESKLKCIDLDGKEQWRKRGLGMGALMAADGRLIVASEKGDLVVVAATPEKYRELSRKRVFTGGACWTNPVLAAGRIYMRNADGELVCLDHRSD